MSNTAYAQLSITDISDLSIVKQIVKYQLTDSGSLEPTDWGGDTDYTALPTLSTGKYLWTQTTTVYDDGGEEKRFSSCSVSYIGTNGSSARVYMLDVSSLCYVVDNLNNLTTTEYTVSSYYRTGTTASKTAYSGRFVVLVYDGSDWSTIYTSSANEKSKSFILQISQNDDSSSSISDNTIILDKNVVCIKTILYASGGTTNALDSQTSIFTRYGETGNGIQNIVDMYLCCNENTGVTTDYTGWTSNILEINSDNKYLWNYEIITYTNGTISKSDPVLIGTYVDTVQTVERLYFAGTKFTNLNNLIEFNDNKYNATGSQALDDAGNYCYVKNGITFTTYLSGVIEVSGDFGQSDTIFNIFPAKNMSPIMSYQCSYVIRGGVSYNMYIRIKESVVYANTALDDRVTTYNDFGDGVVYTYDFHETNGIIYDNDNNEVETVNVLLSVFVAGGTDGSIPDDTYIKPALFIYNENYDYSTYEFINRNDNDKTCMVYPSKPSGVVTLNDSSEYDKWNLAIAEYDQEHSVYYSATQTILEKINGDVTIVLSDIIYDPTIYKSLYSEHKQSEIENTTNILFQSVRDQILDLQDTDISDINSKLGNYDEIIDSLKDSISEVSNNLNETKENVTDTNIKKYMSFDDDKGLVIGKRVETINADGNKEYSEDNSSDCFKTVINEKSMSFTQGNAVVAQITNLLLWINNGIFNDSIILGGYMLKINDDNNESYKGGFTLTWEDDE